jgi:feruloyl esterase
MRKLQHYVCVATATLFTLIAHAQSQLQCEQLSKPSLTKMSIELTQSIPAGQLKDVVQNSLAAQLPAFCRVAATLKPTADSAIKVEVWLPENWNGRLQSVGNGGLAGSISYPAMAAALKEGYATASTDTGHTGNGASGEWALGHPERIVDFGHRAVHEMTVTAKALIKSFYGKSQHHAYWNGCSEGGNQALHEAQRYPQDYDGILAGAPANYMTHLQAGGMWISHAIHKDPATFIAASKLPAINQVVLAACDDNDGLQDGIVSDPRRCELTFERLRCQGAENDQCLTVPQLNGLQKIYTGAKNPHTSEQIFPGYTFGSELEWGSWIAGTDSPPKNRQHMIADNLFKYLVFGRPDWDWKTFDFEKDVATADRVAASTNSVNPDLSAFKQRGGKLLQYHGWYDPAISPFNSINYFDSVQKKLGDTKGFYRLFMVPGMAHCAGGPGIGDFDRMNVIVDWVENRKAPDVIVASKSVNGVARTRPLCPHPQTARYKGTGAIDEAQNFSCVNSGR